MNYSLGNMLSRGGALNPYGLSLDLAFAADKTLTARKGPTPTFTRASTATFVGSNGLIQSAAINTPRFDHDPVTLACKGLLIEESRMNLFQKSEEFDDSYWTKAGLLPITANNGVAPNGAVTADLLTEDTGAAQHRVSRIANVINGSTYTSSVFVKRGAGSRQFGIVITAPSVIARIYYNLDTGTVDTTTAGSGTIKAYPNGWFLCTATGTTAGVSATTFFQLTSGTLSGSETYTGDGTSGLLLWGAQLEIGSFPTSYIPTTTTALARSADVCSITGADFTGFWNQSAGTLVQVFEASPNTNTTYVSASNGNIAANSVHIDNDTGLMRSVYYSGSSLVAELNLGAVGTVGSVNKVATAYSVNDFAASRNGGSAVTDTSGALPIGLSQMNIGTDERSQVPTSFFSNKCISSLRYYNKRLPNAKLQSLTT